MHAPTIDVSQDQPPLPNQHFSPWLRGQTTLFISQISAILGFVLFLASLVYYVLHLGEPGKFLGPKTVKLIVDYAHVVFMAVFILVLIQVLDDNERGSYRVKLVYKRVFGEHGGDYEGDLNKSKAQLKRFKRRFLWFWVGMLFLYVCFTCQHSYDLMNSKAGETIQHAELSFSNMNKGPGGKEEHLKAEFSYEAKDTGEISTSTGEPKDAGAKRLDVPGEICKKLAFPFTVFLFNNLTLLFIFWCFVVLHIPSDLEMEHRYYKYRNVSLFIVTALTLLFPTLAYIKGGGYTVNEWNDFLAVFDALSGVINAIVLALLIARLDSKLIGLPSWLISILYSYAAVQPLFMIFELSESSVLEKISTSVLIFVFVSKIYFFLIILYAMQTGKMLNYLFCFPVLRDRVKNAQSPSAVSPGDIPPSDNDESVKVSKDKPVPDRVLPFLAIQTGKILNYLFCFLTVRDQANNAERPSSVSSGAVPRTDTASDGDESPKVSKEEPLPPGRVMRFLTYCDKFVCDRLGRRRKRYITRARRCLSSGLRGNYPLTISKWLGLASISYFFLSLIVFLVIPNSTSTYWVRARFYQIATGIKDAYVYRLFPKSAGIKWKDIFNVVIDGAQLLVVLGIIVTIYLIRNENRYGGNKVLKTANDIFNENLKPKYPPKEAKTQLRKFKEYFLYFWCLIFLLYIVILFKHLHIGLCLNTDSSITLTSGILGLTPDCGAAPLERSMGFMLNKLFYPFLEFLLSTLNLLFIFWCFVILRSPAFNKRAIIRQKQLINSSSFVIALLIAVFPLLLFILGAPDLPESNLRGYATVFDGVTGTLSAVVLALLIARMDSKLFGLPAWSIGMLFAYASIQPLFVAFALNANVLNMVQTSVLTTAFGLKICFFLIIARSLQGGSALNYLVCFPFLKERVDSIFENQFEIRLARDEHKFTFSILKKNELYYSTPIRFETRKECDQLVNYLRDQMKKREAYRPPPKDKNSPSLEESGTYWVEVRSEAPGRKLLCESIPLKSDEEVRELIAESMDRIPYCKYNRI
jgi:hypothetical protein